MSLSDLLHKIVDVAAGTGQRQDLHDEIDDLDQDSAEAAPDSAPEAEPAEAEAAPEPEPVQAPEPAPPVDVQEPVQVHVQEEGTDGEADG